MGMTPAEKKRLERFNATVDTYAEYWRIGKMNEAEVVLAIIRLINKERNPWVRYMMTGALTCLRLAM